MDPVSTFRIAFPHIISLCDFGLQSILSNSVLFFSTPLATSQFPIYVIVDHQRIISLERYKYTGRFIGFDFDIALVSCGGFGMLVCNYIYSKLNKSCIYVGGVLQLYFGIYGKRWLTSDSSVGNITNHFNEYWTKVLDSDKPKDLQKVENGCYW